MISPEILRRCSYFADVRDESLDEIAKIAEEETYPGGLVIFRDGDKADKLFLLIEGQVELQYTLGNGQRRTVDTIGPGELIMWSALVRPYRSTAVGTTRQAARMITIDGEKLRELFEQDFELGYRVLAGVNELLAARLEHARVG